MFILIIKESETMGILFLCIKIFFVRIIDVSMGTIRTIVTIKGKSFYAALIGFFEVLIWFLIAKEALNTDEKSFLIPIFYSLGYATGTYIGSKLSKKFERSNFGVQVVTSSREVIKVIRDSGYGLTVLDAKSEDNKEKYMIFIDIESTKFNSLKKIIKKIDEKAFMVVMETKYVQNGYFK